MAHRLLLMLLFPAALASAQVALSEAKPVPRMQAVPQPYHQVSFQKDGREIARYHYGPDLRRPFLSPVVGPSGRVLTRMGHPHDPEGHSHHNSVWISHNDAGGVSFWADRAGAGRVLHEAVELLEDGAEAASIVTRNVWKSGGGHIILRERRVLEVRDLGGSEYLIVLDMTLEPPETAVTLGKTPFGTLGVRMAKSIGVRDGGGMIRNSEGGVNEANVLWKRARWVDYSGPVSPGAHEGITLMDHPGNPNHPSFFHVRDDGWMGASLTYEAPLTIERGKALQLRYGLYVHTGVPAGEQIERVWGQFANSRRAEPPPEAKKK